MKKRRYEYPAFRVFQTPDSKPLLLLAAPASEISEWVGIPQRNRLAGEENVGFQRQVTPSRVNELARFFENSKNVVQNPLLCATQSDVDVQFEVEPGSDFGKLIIETDDIETLGLGELITRVIALLERRLPALAGQTVDQERRVALFNDAKAAHPLVTGLGLEDSEDYGPEPEANSGADDTNLDPGAVLYAEETQIAEFHQELVIRADILGVVPAEHQPDELVGFTGSSGFRVHRALG